MLLVFLEEIALLQRTLKETQRNHALVQLEREPSSFSHVINCMRTSTQERVKVRKICLLLTPKVPVDSTNFKQYEIFVS